MFEALWQNRLLTIKDIVSAVRDNAPGLFSKFGLGAIYYVAAHKRHSQSTFIAVIWCDILCWEVASRESVAAFVDVGRQSGLSPMWECWLLESSNFCAFLIASLYSCPHLQSFTKPYLYFILIDDYLEQHFQATFLPLTLCVSHQKHSAKEQQLAAVGR